MRQIVTALIPLLSILCLALGGYIFPIPTSLTLAVSPTSGYTPFTVVFSGSFRRTDLNLEIPHARLYVLVDDAPESGKGRIASVEVVTDRDGNYAASLLFSCTHSTPHKYNAVAAWYGPGIYSWPKTSKVVGITSVTSRSL